MADTEPQTAIAKVLWHFLMSLDGFVAGPNHAMEWTTGFSVRPGLHAEYIATTGAVLAGRDGFDSAIGDCRPYGGSWQRPVFVLTHHPQDARPAEGITVLSCPVEEAVQIGDSIRLYEKLGGDPIRIRRVGNGDPTAVLNVRYRPSQLVDRSSSDCSASGKQ